MRKRRVVGSLRSVVVSLLINSWCFKLSQPKGTISELKETFMKRCIVKRTNKAEFRSEEQSEKAESCWENLWNEIQLKWPQIYGMKYSRKGHADRNRHQNRIKKRSGQARLAYVRHKPYHHHHVKVSPRGPKWD